MAISFQDTLIRLNNLGLTDVILPFVLIFTITFAILQRTGIFGDAKKEGRKFNTIFAMVMGLIVVVPHVLGQYPNGYDVVQIINSSLPGISLVMVVIISLLLVMATFGLDAGFKKSNGIKGFFTLLSIVAIVGIFGTSLGWWQLNGIFSFLNDPDLQAMIVVIAFFWMIISFVTGSPEEAAAKKNIFQQLGELVEGEEGGGRPPAH